MITATIKETVAGLAPVVVPRAEPTGWDLLLSPLPDESLTPLSAAVYGAAGLSDINEAYLLERLHRCGLKWEISTPAFEERENKNVMCNLSLVIDGKVFHGVGGHQGRRLDVSYKGAYTQAFKNACKWAGLTLSVYMGGKAKDDPQETDVKNPRAANAVTATPPVNPGPDRDPVAGGSGSPTAIQQTLMDRIADLQSADRVAFFTKHFKTNPNRKSVLSLDDPAAFTLIEEIDRDWT